jgi:hypothetical protein
VSLLKLDLDFSDLYNESHKDNLKQLLERFSKKLNDLSMSGSLCDTCLPKVVKLCPNRRDTLVLERLELLNTDMFRNRKVSEKK